MNKNGPIVIIEDDADDRFLLETAFAEIAIQNRLIFFVDAAAALDYLKITTELPFLVLSDVNLPKMGGFELRMEILNLPDVARKCVPYIFLSTAVTPEILMQAYGMSVQGFFKKPTSYGELTNILRQITGYWAVCYSTNTST